jgi:hypothetical protein
VDKSEQLLQLTPRERKKRRPDLGTLIEEQKLKSYKTFLSSFKELKDGVDTLHGELSQLNGICESMSNNLWASKQSSRNLIDEIAKLEGERRKLEVERDLAQAYLNAFQLDAEDLKTLRGTESSAPMLSEEFFKVVIMIIDKCTVGEGTRFIRGLLEYVFVGVLTELYCILLLPGFRKDPEDTGECVGVVENRASNNCSGNHRSNGIVPGQLVGR